MAFSCRKNNEPISSFEYSLEDWITLKADKKSIFKMTCCSNHAILKTSKLGTQFFAHKVKPKNLDCFTGGETAEHIYLKYLVSKKLFECGWSVEVEKRGMSSKGDVWIADIYAEKDKFKVAIEVQWSRQSFIEIKHRQQVYKDSGVRGAWLLRSGSVKDRNAIVGDFLHRTKSLPVFSIYKNKSSDYYEVYNINTVNFEEGLIFNPLKPTKLELSNFVEKLVSSKINFYPKHSPTADLSVNIIRMGCSDCGRVTNMVERVRFKNKIYGLKHESSNYVRSVDQCNEQTVNSINISFSRTYNFAPLRSRYSETEDKNYIANSCTHCDALISRHFLKSWGSYYSNTMFETNEVVIHNQKHMDFEIGEWVLN